MFLAIYCSNMVIQLLELCNLNAHWLDCLFAWLIHAKHCTLSPVWKICQWNFDRNKMSSSTITCLQQKCVTSWCCLCVWFHCICLIRMVQISLNCQHIKSKNIKHSFLLYLWSIWQNVMDLESLPYYFWQLYQPLF